MANQIYPAIADGILGGGVYALMAVGLTLIFGVLDIINVAQGILVVVGGYLSYALSVHLHIDLFVGLLITVPAMFVLGVVIHTTVIRPLRAASAPRCRCCLFRRGDHPRRRAVLDLRPQRGRAQRLLRPVGLQGSRVLHQRHLRVLLRARGDPRRRDLPAAVQVPVRRAVRATMQDPVAARLVGINVNRVAALTFGIGVAVTAAGGMAFGATTGGFNPTAATTSSPGCWPSSSWAAWAASAARWPPPSS